MTSAPDGTPLEVRRNFGKPNTAAQLLERLKAERKKAKAAPEVVQRSAATEAPAHADDLHKLAAQIRRENHAAELAGKAAVQKAVAAARAGPALPPGKAARMPARKASAPAPAPAASAAPEDAAPSLPRAPPKAPRSRPNPTRPKHAGQAEAPRPSPAPAAPEPAPAPVPAPAPAQRRKARASQHAPAASPASPPAAQAALADAKPANPQPEPAAATARPAASSVATAKPLDTRGMEPKHVVEAALFSAGKPLMIDEIAMQTRLSPETIKKAIHQLQSDYDGRDSVLEVGKAGAKWAMQVRSRAAEPAARFAPMEIAPKLLKTLALIAYHQPMKQSELVDMIGTKVYDHVPALVERGLVRAREEGVTKILATTPAFPEYFGLDAEDTEGVRAALAKLVGLPPPPPKPAKSELTYEEPQPAPEGAAAAEPDAATPGPATKP